MLITLKQVNTSIVEKEKDPHEQKFDREAVWSGVANFHCMQMSLVMSMRFMSAMIEMTRHVHHVSALFLSNRGSCIDFHIFIDACSINSETNRRL